MFPLARSLLVLGSLCASLWQCMPSQRQTLGVARRKALHPPTTRVVGPLQEPSQILAPAIRRES